MDLHKVERYESGRTTPSPWHPPGRHQERYNGYLRRDYEESELGLYLSRSLGSGTSEFLVNTIADGFVYDPSKNPIPIGPIVRPVYPFS